MLVNTKILARKLQWEISVWFMAQWRSLRTTSFAADKLSSLHSGIVVSMVYYKLLLLQ